MSDINSKISESLSEVLISESLITEREAVKYENMAKKVNLSLYQYLFINNIIPEIDIIYALSSYYKYNYLNIDVYEESFLPQHPDVNWIEKNRVVPIRLKGENNSQTLHIVISDLSNTEVIENEAKRIYKCKYVHFLLSEETRINKHLERFQKPAKENFSLSRNLIEEKMKDTQLTTSTIKTSENVIVNDKKDNDKPLTDFIQKILMDAINSNVSDIHFEPYENYYRVRFRQNGEMYDTSVPPAYINEKLTQKLKLIAKMEVNNPNPQLGRINLQFFGGRDIDFRVSSFPTLFGEKIVLQVEDSQNIDIGLSGLGIQQEDIEEIEKIIETRKKGLMIFSGKPRSGKTLTAYNCMKLLNPQKFNIYTVEKISTLKVKGINQMLLNPNGDISTIDILKQLHYQDTDVLLFEEIQNKEELKQLLSLSNKGNIILSTLNSASLRGTLDVLREKGLSINEVVNNVSLISYQVMFKKLCEDCKVKENWSKIALINMGFTAEDVESYNLTWATYNSIGCTSCSHRKTKGSVVSFQILTIHDRMKEIIYENMKDKSEDELFEILLSMLSEDIRKNIIDQIKKGEISYQEGESALELYIKK